MTPTEPAPILDTARNNREIQRYFLALVVIASVSIPLVAVFISLSRAGEDAQRNRLESFHLRSAMITVEAMTAVSEVQRELLLQRAASPDRTRPVMNRAIDSKMHSLGQSVDAIAALHREWIEPDDRFTGPVGRVVRKFERLRVATSKDPSDLDEVNACVDSLGFSLFQFERLLSLSTEEWIDQIANSQARARQRVTIATVLLLLIVGLIMARLLVLLRIRLQEHERLQKELFDRERQLQQSRKLEALGTLVGGVAHDFNNLLTLILGHTEMLLGGIGGAESRHEALLQIQKAGERSAALTKQLLAFSRQQPIDFRVIDLNEKIRGAESMIRRLIREDIELVLELDSEDCVVEIDPVQWELLLINLAVNARDAMPDGGRMVIRTLRHASSDSWRDDPDCTPGEYVTVQVEDTGCGMSSETRSRVFDPFFTTKGLGKGTGLGLSTVHGVVRQGGGCIRVESEPGVGTQFAILLPSCDKPLSEPRAEVAESETRSRTETILVAEDEPEIRAMAVARLRQEGYRVLDAGNGEEALRICSGGEESVDLILSDVIMPGISGPELVERALEFHPAARALLVSGYSENELEPGTWRSGVHVLTKPFTMGELARTVRQILDAPQSRHPEPKSVSRS